MKADPSLEAWKVFLRGRIAQEQGKDEEALKLLDAALKIEPENRHFLAARAAVLGHMGRDREAVTTSIAARYGDLARGLSGEKDQPGPWLQGLEKLLRDADEMKAPTRFVSW